MSSTPNGCRVQFQKYKDVNNGKQGVVKLLNFPDVNNAIQASQQLARDASTKRKKPNLVPRNYRQSFFTILSSQEKWNLVFEKLIDVLDHTASVVQNQMTESKK
jgi:hypothetical protein